MSYQGRSVTLTNTAIENMHESALWDSVVPGLHIRTLPTGKTFYLYYRINGRQRKPKLGVYPLMTLALAREKAREMLRGVMAGLDPRAGFTSRDVTMEELWQVTQRDIYNRGRRWDKEAARLWRSKLSHKLGSYKVRAVTPPILDDVAASMRSTPVQANRAMAVVSKMFKVAIRKGLIEPRDNPTGYIPRNPEEHRERYASPDELRALVAEIRKLPIRNFRSRAFFWLLLYSGARPSEIERATWGQLYDQPNGSGVLVIKEGKRGRRRVVLPPQAMAEIARLPEGGKNDPIVGIKFPRRIWNRIREKAGCPDLWGRDLRRTFATVGLSNVKAPVGAIGELLGHRSDQTTKIYARLTNDAARGTAADIADEIDEIIGPRKIADISGDGNAVAFASMRPGAEGSNYTDSDAGVKSRDAVASPSSAEPILPVVSGVS